MVKQDMGIYHAIMAYVAIALAFLLGIFIGRELTNKRLQQTADVAVKVVENLTPRKKIVVLKKKEPLDYAVESALAIEKGKGMFSFFKK